MDDARPLLSTYRALLDRYLIKAIHPIIFFGFHHGINVPIKIESFNIFDLNPVFPKLRNFENVSSRLD